MTTARGRGRDAERMLLRIHCSRPRGAHLVGAVVETADGELELRITVPVAGPDGIEAAEAVIRDVDSLRYRGEGAEGADRERIHRSTDAWCEKCQKPLPVELEDLFDSARLGERRVRQLDAEGAAAAAVKRRRQRWLQAQRPSI